MLRKWSVESSECPHIERRCSLSPGLLGVVLGNVRLGIWYPVEVYSKATRWDWLFGVVYIGCFIVIGMNKIGHTLLADEDSPYPFAPEEMRGSTA